MAAPAYIITVPVVGRQYPDCLFNCLTGFTTSGRSASTKHIKLCELSSGAMTL